MASPTPATPHDPALRRTSFWLLLVVACAFVFLDYWSYSAQFRTSPEALAALSSGTGPAPAQYRVGVIYAAKAILRATDGHLSYRHSFAIFDLLCTLAAGLLTRGVLMRTRSFAAATPVSQWLRIVALLGLVTYYCNWSLWYQRPETWTCTLFVAASFYLLSAIRSSPALALGLVALAIVQGFVRADVAILFHFALFIYVLFRGASGFLVSRGILLLSSFLGGVLPTAILWILMHRVFPHATYGDTPVFQLLRNLSPVQWIPALLFLVPTLFTYYRGSSRRSANDGPAHTLLLAAALYFLSWAVVGRLEEVRIFVPFAFALIPLTVNALAMRVEQTSLFALPDVAGNASSPETAVHSRT